ncbi:MAG: diguanylate cyclase [Desulfobulbaceae bacterium BRH_c16a]|nr:MAG: diguanylate cyclase [Desulfobulbaceae bacterium BRH_c16a]
MEERMIDTFWVVIAATLVFLMQPGFMCLESGLTRSKNSINVAVKNLADFILSVLLFWALGYGLMFGASHAGIVGTTHFSTDFGEDYRLATFFFFQMMFCGTATTIFSGAVAERMKFSSYLIVVLLLSTAIYPLFGHWAWNGFDRGTPSGWLGSNGFVDFAGSTVVHSVGGWVALAVLLIIGPRMHRFGKDCSFYGFSGSNLPLSVLGTLLLWIGWIGFNGGSTLAMNGNVPRIIAYTTLAGAAGALANLSIGYFINRVPRVPFLINGSLGGLVAITAGCHCVDAMGAVTIGAVAGVICFATEILLIRVKIDDAVGAVPVHLACGIWGTLAVALFGAPELIGTGLSLPDQIFAQLKGILAAFLIAFLLPFTVFRQINRFFPFRVSAEDEHNGLNYSEHGATTELIELCQAMDRQVESRNLSMRMPVEPFTEVGLIAARHNQIMDSLETALSHTEAVVNLANDAIVTFVRDSLEIININPSGRLMFGFADGRPGAMIRLPDLFARFDHRNEQIRLWRGETIETLGRKTSGNSFPMQAVITEAGRGEHTFCIGTFRDITELRERERSLRESELRYRDLFENIGVATIMIEADATLAMVNHEAELLSGYSKQEMEHTMTFPELLPESDTERLRYHSLRKIPPQGAANSYEGKLRDCNGRMIPVYVNVSAIPGTDRTVATIIDLSELRLTQSSLTRQRAFFLQLFDGSSQAIVALDKNRQILHVNKGFEQLFGYREDEIRGMVVGDVVVPSDRREEVEVISKTVLSGNFVKKETLRQRKDGSLIPVSMLGFPIKVDDALEGIFYIYEDISERKAFEEQLYRQAFFDGLTDIPNRILFMERLNRALERRKRRDDFNFAVLLIDLDRFKWINDSLGHLTGDDLLQKVSQRFLSCVRSGDTVARLGGDEFAILIEEFEKSSQVIEIANRLQKEAQTPFFIGATDVHISASIGIVLNTAAYDSTEAILRDADIAMYRAKELGKARFQVFNRKLHMQASEALQLENDLREAITAGHLRLDYQPIISIPEKKLIAFEALVRWLHPEKGLIGPEKFIPIAEETGLIIPLGEWVLAEACRQLKSWQTTLPGATHLKINVNISAKQFLQNNLVATVLHHLEQTGLDPRCLKLELTESTIMEGGRHSVDRFNRLKEIGVKLAIDDFGTGYSSLSSLQQLPIDELKIDRSFIGRLEQSDQSKAIVRTIIALARTLGLGIVAEGVEKLEQLACLESMQCDAVQGYLFSPPVQAEKVSARVADYFPGG